MNKHVEELPESLIMLRVCSNCNKEFLIKSIKFYRQINSFITNFENCPHCDQRNDTWILVKTKDCTNCLHHHQHPLINSDECEYCNDLNNWKSESEDI